MTLKHPTHIPEITPEEAQVRLQAGATLIDVREDSEWQEVHAQGAHHIALGKLPNAVQTVKELAEQGEILTICAHGIRSARAAEILIQAGVKATSVTGGTADWIAARLPVVEGDTDA